MRVYKPEKPFGTTIEDATREPQRGRIPVVLLTPIPRHEAYEPFVEYLRNLQLAGVIDLHMPAHSRTPQFAYCIVDGKLHQTTDTVRPEELHATTSGSIRSKNVMQELGPVLKARDQRAVVLLPSTYVTIPVEVPPFEFTMTFDYHDKFQKKYPIVGKLDIPVHHMGGFVYNPGYVFDDEVVGAVVAGISDTFDGASGIDAAAQRIYENLQNATGKETSYFNVSLWYNEIARWRHTSMVFPFQTENKSDGYKADEKDFNSQLKSRLRSEIAAAWSKKVREVEIVDSGISQVTVLEPEELIVALQKAVEILGSERTLPTPEEAFGVGNSVADLANINGKLKPFMEMVRGFDKTARAIHDHCTKRISRAPVKDVAKLISQLDGTRADLQLITDKYGRVDSNEMTIEETLKVCVAIIALDEMNQKLDAISQTPKGKVAVEKALLPDPLARDMSIRIVGDQEILNLIINLKEKHKTASKTELQMIDMVNDLTNGRLAALEQRVFEIVSQQSVLRTLDNLTAGASAEPLSVSLGRFDDEVERLTRSERRVAEIEAGSQADPNIGTQGNGKPELHVVEVEPKDSGRNLG